MKLAIQKLHIIYKSERVFYQLMLGNKSGPYILINDLPKGSRKFGFGLLKGASSSVQKYKIHRDFNSEYYGDSISNDKFLEKIECISNKSSNTKLSWSLHPVFSSPFL